MSRRAVLDEDTYVNALDSVIRRDYYPSTINEDDEIGGSGRGKHNDGDKIYGDDEGYGYSLDDDSDQEEGSNYEQVATKADNLTDFHRKVRDHLHCCWSKEKRRHRRAIL